MKKYILFLPLIFFSCCSQKKAKQEDKPDEQLTTDISFDKLDIPKHWIEITKQDNVWIYFIPCKNVRDLQTIEITNVANQNAISCNFGTEGQWFAIKRIQQQDDSLCITTALPYDTSLIETFTMKYIDKEKKLVWWSSADIHTTFIPTEDTIKYKRVVVKCKSE